MDTIPTARRRRTPIVAATAASAAAAILLIAPPGAVAIPPGGPLENPGSATLTVEQPIVAPGATVAFHGSGFDPGEVVSVKLDDGLVLPAAPVAGADVFARVTADPDGDIDGALDLATVAAADAAEVQSGKHHLRLLSGTPRSIHADFAVSATLPTAQIGAAGTTAVVGPPADQLLQGVGPGGGDLPWSGIPRLAAGSLVPYRLSGFAPGVTLSVKVNDGAVSDPSLTRDVWARVTPDAAGEASGTLALPTTTPGTYWLRFLAAGRSVIAPYAVVATGARALGTAATVAPGAALALSGSGLVREPADYANGEGQTLVSRLDGSGPALTATAAEDGSLSASLPIPAETATGDHTLVTWSGFARQNDYPQAVYATPFAVAPAQTGPGEQPPVEQPPAGGGGQPGAGDPPRRTTPAKPAAVVSKALKAKRAALALVLAPGTTKTRATIVVRTNAKVALERGAKRRIVVVAQLRRVLLDPAKRRVTVRVPLTKAGRALLRAHARLRVKVRVAPAKGRAVVRVVTVRR